MAKTKNREELAVIQTGGKQYIVGVGEKLEVEKLSKKAGETITFKPLLVVNGGEVKVGNPEVEGGEVKMKVEGEKRGKKVSIVKFKSKTRYHKRQGHRQPYTILSVIDIDIK
ncbi:MAG TPA: 50S ribosomal protein L21 [Candidatus Paceibacterota bacterium]